MRRRPGRGRRRLAAVITAGPAGLVVPGPYYLGFSSDNNPTMPYNPNFKYHPFSNTSNGGTVSGTWGSTGTTGTIYDNRPPRQALTYTGGSVSKWALYNNATAGHGLEFDGSKTDTRFLHDGSVSYNIYTGFTRRSTSAHRILSSMTALTPVGTILQGRSGNQHINFAIGNGSSAVINHVGVGSQLSTDNPHCVTVFVSAYGGIGTQGTRSRTDSNAVTAATNWAAAPASGSDAVATLKMFDTLDGHGNEIWVTPGYEPGTGMDLAWKAFVETRTGVGLAPDSWSLPVLPIINFIGDSLTDDSQVVSLTQSRWCERITLNKAFKLNRNAQAGKQVGPVGTGTAGTVMTSAASLLIDDGFYNASAPKNIFVIMGGTNDLNSARSGAQILSDLTSMVSHYHALGAGVIVVHQSVIDAAVFDASERSELDSLNSSILSNASGADYIADNTLTLGSYHDWWTEHPEFRIESESPNFIHMNVAGGNKFTQSMTAILDALI